jgi:hypothetical protein
MLGSSITRTQSITVIQDTLASLDDAAVAAVAEIVQSMAFKFRDLTPDELAGIDRSRADFREGRTYSAEEALALTDAFVAKLLADEAK